MYDPLRYGVNVPANVATDLTGGGLPKAGAFLLNLCNRAETDRMISVAITAGGAPTDADWIEYEAPLGPKRTSRNVLSRDPVPLGVGWRVYVLVAGTGVTATLLGLK